MDDPVLGGCHGWQEIEAAYKRAFADSDSVKATFEYSIVRLGETFLARGTEHRTNGDGAAALEIRTSRLFSLINGRWRQLHHHGSLRRPVATDGVGGASEMPNENLPREDA